MAAIPRRQAAGGEYPACQHGYSKGSLDLYPRLERVADMDRKKPIQVPIMPHRLGLCALFLMTFASQAMEFTGHHGGAVINCKDPEFYQESPAPNAKVSRLEKVSFIASDNTMTDSLIIQVNLEPAKTRIIQNGNGTFTVEADLALPITKDRAWIKVTGHSDDGCQQIHTWDVFVEPDGK